MAEAIDPLERAIALREPAPLTHAALVIAYVAGGAASNAHDHLEAVRKFDRDLARELTALFITTW